MSSKAASDDDQETMVLRATPSIKRYNVARFDTPQLPNLRKSHQPVMMYREPERVHSSDEEEEGEETGAFQKKRRRRRKKNRTAGWIIEDKDECTKFQGTFEGGQASTYMLLVRDPQTREFSAIPVEQWFRFKKPLNYRTLTYEEAEELNNEKKRAVERWLMKHKLAGDDTKADPSGEAVSAGPRLRTGAVGASGGKKTGTNEDVFSVSEGRARRPARRSKPAGGDDATGENGGDFEEVFDDDEEMGVETQQADANVDSEDDEDELDGDGTTGGNLTEAGQAMKDLLKKDWNSNMPESNGKEADENEDEDEEYSAEDMATLKRDLGGNIISVGNAVGKTSEATTENANPTEEANGKQVETKEAKPETQKIVGVKRKAEGDANGKAKEDKQAKNAANAAASSNGPRLTEAGVQQELMRFGGRMRTRDLLKKLRKQLTTEENKKLLRDILRTICDVEEDAIDGRMLVLKSQFR